MARGTLHWGQRLVGAQINSRDDTKNSVNVSVNVLGMIQRPCTQADGRINHTRTQTRTAQTDIPHAQAHIRAFRHKRPDKLTCNTNEDSGDDEA